MAGWDVAVVGLGAMGAAALSDMAARGARVIGLERFRTGHDRGSSHGETRALRLGYFEHPAYVPLLGRALALWQALERAAGTALFTRTGVLEAGPPDSPVVQGSIAASREHGLRHDVLDRAALANRFPMFTLPPDYGAVWQPDGGHLRPEAAIGALIGRARAAGAAIREETPVIAIEPGAQDVRLHLPGETLAVGRVVVTAGPWIGTLIPALAPHLALTRQVMCWFAPRDPAAVAPGRLPVFLVDGAVDLAYGFPDLGRGMKCAAHGPSGRLEHADDARQDAGPDDAARMRRFLEAYLPAAAGPVRAMKTCLYTRTPDGDFVIDHLPDSDRVTVISACSGHGFKFAPVIGEIAADLALAGGTDHPIARFRLDRLRG